MSVQTREADTGSGTTDHRLWHKAADAEQHRRASEGLSWRTRCGQDVKPAVERSRKAWNLAPMERCAVCMSIPPPEAKREDTE